MLVDISKENYEKVIKESDSTILYLWADWNSQSVKFKPVFEDYAKKHRDITFGSIDTDEEHEVTNMLAVKKIPVLILLKGTVVLAIEYNAINEMFLRQACSQLKQISQQQIRQQIEMMKRSA